MRFFESVNICFESFEADSYDSFREHLADLPLASIEFLLSKVRRLFNPRAGLLLDMVCAWLNEQRGKYKAALPSDDTNEEDASDDRPSKRTRLGSEAAAASEDMHEGGLDETRAMGAPPIASDVAALLALPHPFMHFAPRLRFNDIGLGNLARVIGATGEVSPAYLGQLIICLASGKPGGDVSEDNLRSYPSKEQMKTVVGEETVVTRFKNSGTFSMTVVDYNSYGYRDLRFSLAGDIRDALYDAKPLSLVSTPPLSSTQAVLEEVDVLFQVKRASFDCFVLSLNAQLMGSSDPYIIDQLCVCSSIERSSSEECLMVYFGKGNSGGGYSSLEGPEAARVLHLRYGKCGQVEAAAATAASSASHGTLVGAVGTAATGSGGSSSSSSGGSQQPALDTYALSIAFAATGEMIYRYTFSPDEHATLVNLSVYPRNDETGVGKTPSDFLGGGELELALIHGSYATREL